MSFQQPRVNRGPAAAPANRQAILDAARLLFSENGYNVPLSQIAKKAGVSQGVMYRHFRDRSNLAYAVFEENYETLGKLAENPEPEAIFSLWECLLDYAVTATAFVELLLSLPTNTEYYDGKQRLLDLLEPPLQNAQRAGILSPTLTTEHLFVGWKMAYGIAVLSPRRTEEINLVRETLSLTKIELLFG